MIVVGNDDTSTGTTSSRIQVFEYSEEGRKWQNIQNIVGIAFDPVHDVAFAPNIGRLARRERFMYINITEFLLLLLERIM